MHAPRIIITLAGEHTQNGEARLYSRAVYASAVERAGANVLFVGRTSDESGLDDIFSIADGLLLPGGDDINPERYGEVCSPLCMNIDAARDHTELELLRRAYHAQVPVLGICRGMQVINTFCGGTLYQDVPAMFDARIVHRDDTLPRSTELHDVIIVPDSHLASITHVETTRVNSIHHQAVKQLGAGLSAGAHAPDGLIEAVEHETHPFLLGVQWHPEELADIPSSELFRAFVTSASAYRKHRHETI